MSWWGSEVTGGAGAPCAQLAPSLVWVSAWGNCWELMVPLEPVCLHCPGPPSGCPHLGKHVRVGVILQKHRSCPGVVVAGRDVQGREPHLPFRPIVDEVCHHVLMALLQSHG